MAENIKKACPSEIRESISFKYEHLLQGVDVKKRRIQLIPGNIKDLQNDDGLLDDRAFAYIDASMSLLEDLSGSDITIVMSGYGGSVYSALAIVGRLRSSKCSIITEAYGTIQSAMTLIFACGDHRRLSKYANFMHHESNYDLPRDRHSAIKAYVNQAGREEKEWAKWMSEFSFKDEGFYLKKGKYIDVYWSPDELVELGIVDEIF